MPKNKGAKAAPNSKSQEVGDVLLADAEKAKELDQYYTKPGVAASCWNEVVNYLGGELDGWQFVEPSAGEGAFLSIMPTDTIAIDKDPKAPGILAGDFLNTQLPTDLKIAVVGNPPFGKNASGAVAFFKHAAKQSKLIGMILPLTFIKASTQNRLDPAFRKMFEMRLPKNAFTFLGKSRNVPAVFQIWERCNEPRAQIPVEMSHPDFVFTTAGEADYVVWRVGVKAGEIHHDFTMSKSSHYFIRVTNKAVDVEKIMGGLASAFAEAAGNTAGNPSLAKSELVAIYKDYMANAGAGVLSPAPIKEPTIKCSEVTSTNFVAQSRRHQRREVRSNSSRWEMARRLRWRRRRRWRMKRQRLG